MPRRDGTGPQGEGPMTGGCRGVCASGLPRGEFYGRGRGRGIGRSYLGAEFSDTELKAQKIVLEERLAAIDKRLETKE